MTIGKMRHRVLVCAWIEEPDADVSILRERPGVFEAYASIKPRKATRVFESRVAYGDENTPTHEIIIRYPNDVMINSQNWIYEESKGVKRWFRVHAIEDVDERQCYLKLLVRQTEVKDPRRDPVIQKENVDFEVPNGPLFGGNAGL